MFNAKAFAKELNNTNYYDSIKNLLSLGTHRLQVKFAFLAAKDLEQFYDEQKHPKVKAARAKALKLVADWLLGKPVTKAELEAATDAAYAAANAASAPAHAAANAAHAVAHAASAAAYAAYAAADAAASAAAYAAASAADAAASAAASAASAAAYAAANKQSHLKYLHSELIKLIIEEYDLDMKVVRLLYDKPKGVKS